MDSVHIRRLPNARRLTKENRYLYNGELSRLHHGAFSSTSQSPEMESFIS